MSLVIPGYSHSSAAAPSGSWQLPIDEYEPAVNPLFIQNPRAGLTEGATATSYYYRVRIGQIWRVPVSVNGGAWPFHYELLTNPTGMTIGEDADDQDYGYLVWDTTGVTQGLYAVSVQVTDQEGTTATVSWNLYVGNQNSLILDAVSGDDANDGLTEANAMQTFAGWHTTGAGSRDNSTYDGWHIYYKAGVYPIDDSFDSVIAGNYYMKMNSKPMQHIAWRDANSSLAGSNAIFDYAGDPGGANKSGGRFEAIGFPDFATVGLEFRGICSGSGARQQGWRLSANNALSSLISECLFDNQAGAGISGQNPCYYIFVDGNRTQGKKYISFHNNEVADLSNMQVYEIYDAEYIVEEGNVTRNCGTLGGVNRKGYFKTAHRYVTIRNNTAILDVRAYGAFIDSFGSLADLWEICWNNFKLDVSRSDVANTDAVIQIGSETATMGQGAVYRNNFGGGNIQIKNGGGGGPVTFYSNVQQYTSDPVETDGFREVLTAGALMSYSRTLGDRADIFGSSGLLDATTNLLTGANRTTYLGLKGCERK